MQNVQSVALRLETVRVRLPLRYEREDIQRIMIQQRRDVETVSSRNIRLPLQIRQQSNAGLANMDGRGCKVDNSVRQAEKTSAVIYT